MLSAAAPPFLLLLLLFSAEAELLGREAAVQPLRARRRSIAAAAMRGPAQALLSAVRSTSRVRTRTARGTAFCWCEEALVPPTTPPPPDDAVVANKCCCCWKRADEGLKEANVSSRPMPLGRRPNVPPPPAKVPPALML